MWKGCHVTNSKTGEHGVVAQVQGVQILLEGKTEFEPASNYNETKPETRGPKGSQGNKQAKAAKETTTK